MTNILIVDDDAPYLDALREQIRSLYPLLAVMTCTDPFQALAILKSEPMTCSWSIWRCRFWTAPRS